MQAIRTHYLPATNFKPSRIKAVCERGSLTVSYDSGLNENDAHAAAAKALVARFVKEDAAKYGSPAEKNPWARPFVSGTLPDGSMAHVYLPVSRL
jgi:hypothetical protein